MEKGSVSAGYLKSILDYAVDKGASRSALLAAVDLDDAIFADADNRVPMEKFRRMMQLGAAHTNNPAFSLDYCWDMPFVRTSIVGLIAESTANMGEALAQLNRYGQLVAEVDIGTAGKRFALVPEGNELWLEDTRINPNEFPELTESTFGRFICEFRRHFGDTPFVKRIKVTHERPAHYKDYDRVLQAPVEFAADRNAMEIETSWLTVETDYADRYAFGILSKHADALMKELESSKTIKGRAESIMIPVLHTGELTMDQVAEKMGLSRQSLYRGLKAEGISFEQLRDDLRHKMACHYLAEKKVSANETAYLVGFSDPSAFSRAFKRWTGQAPGSWQAVG
ncbi:AraC-like DNA-binding protein [Maritalea mobilis]|uniref:AraC-like DNA-binding protein n=1 Tax=Maritalea mobilis TaxID=483324 RepID=A0A4V3DAV4_9HYPH|nr:AraC family transcriptional regulator [Maritalea mobilis]TDQ63934.1 AraC-like DNA-binding protein [Maritalea mobilis]